MVKPFWWLLTYAWRPRIEQSYESRDVQPVKTYRMRRESPPLETTPDEVPESNEFQRQLAEAKAPIRCYGNPQDIYLA